LKCRRGKPVATVAEVIAANRLIELGSVHHAKEKGLLKLEGKDYLVQDGDVVFFRFNV